MLVIVRLPIFEEMEIYSLRMKARHYPSPKACESQYNTFALSCRDGPFMADDFETLQTIELSASLHYSGGTDLELA